MAPASQTFTPDPAWDATSRAGTLGPTHGSVVVTADGLIHCSTDGPRPILVFHPDATSAGLLDPGFSVIHDLKPVVHHGKQRWLACHLAGNRVVLLENDGRTVMALSCPLESGFYQDHAGFHPTAALLAPDGSFHVADGYGASVIHHFDTLGRYLKSFGGEEAGEGQLRNCHGLALDTRGPEPLLLVCDRRNRRLVHFSLDGRYIGTLASGMRRPCNVAFHGDFLAVAELEGRVSILDRDNRTVATVGDNPDRAQWANYEVPPDQWHLEFLNAPHSVAFDHEGNLLVQEWNRWGRSSRWLRSVPA